MNEKLFKNSKLSIYTDGGARGNPGPAAVGYVVGDRKYGETIGHATNNIAEYKAVIFALKKAKHLLGNAESKKTDVLAHMDSQLVCKQMNGEYKIKEPDLQTLFIELWNLRQDFKSVTFIHIPREQNKEADRMVNITLDGKSGAQQEGFI